MKILLFLIVTLCGIFKIVTSTGPNLVCYYDASSSQREGLGQLTLDELQLSLQFCTHLVYGYVGIHPDTFELKSLNEIRDIHQRHLATITALKQNFPHIKFLLSVGGDRDLEKPEKYIQLLEAGRPKQDRFIQSAVNFMRTYNFDGIDLAFQLPRNKPRKVHTAAGQMWKNFKKMFSSDEIIDKKAAEHKSEFTSLVTDLKNALRPNNYMLTLTVLPNVNSSWYYNAPAIINNLDFVNLAAFDFLTPERNSEEADFTAPLFPLYDQNRLPHYNVHHQVSYWKSQLVPHNKINLGIASYGRAWKLTVDSGVNGNPVIPATKGPAPAGPFTKQAGILNWAEICAKLSNPNNVNAKGADAPLRRVDGSSQRNGIYAFRPSDVKGENGIWVSYEDPETAANKVNYAKMENLGGVAFFDLGNDDFRGSCTGDRYPMLRSIKHRQMNN